MKLTWHIILKDIRRDRAALLLWATLFVAQVIVGLVLLQQRDAGWANDKMQVTSVCLAIAQFVMGYVLVARWVHADVLLGTDMFWRTRPIARGRLLLAKALGALCLFGLFPVLLLTPWWLWCGFTARDIFWTGVETFGWQLLMIAPAFLIASLTDEFGRVLLWTIVLFVAVMLWVALLGSLFAAYRWDGEESTWTQTGIIYTGTWLANLLFAICCAAVAAHQYLTKHTVRSIGLMLAGTGLVVVVGFFNRLDWSTTLTDLPRPTPAAETSAALAATKVAPGVSVLDGPSRLKRPGVVALLTEAYFQGLPENTVINWGFARQVWHWDDGLTISRWSNLGRSFGFDGASWLQKTYQLPKGTPDPETTAWLKSKRDELDARLGSRPIKQTLLPPSREGARTFLYAEVPEAMIKRAQANPPAYEAALRGTATTPFIQAELPFRIGAQDGRDSTRVRMMWTGELMKGNRRDESGRPYVALITTPSLQVNGLWLVNAVLPVLKNDLVGELIAMNRETGRLHREGDYSLQSTRRVFVAGVVLNWYHGHLHDPMVIREGKWTSADPQWSEHASIVFVGRKIVGRFATRMQTERMTFGRSKYLEEGETPPAVARD